MVPGGPGPPGHECSLPFGQAGSDQPHVRLSSSHVSSSTRLEDYRRLRGLAVSDASFRLISGSWRPSTAARYDSVWRSFKDFLSAHRVLLISVDLTVVLDYLTHLADGGLAYRMITLHRSVLPATFPPVDRHKIGHHPLISHLLRGVFQNCSPTRRFFASWDVAVVFTVFSSSLPLDFVAFQRKLALLLAMASLRRPSELASLRCSPAFMDINAVSVRFLPSCLSKMDRPGHMGPPILIRRRSFSLARRLSRRVFGISPLSGYCTISCFLLLFRHCLQRLSQGYFVGPSGVPILTLLLAPRATSRTPSLVALMFPTVWWRVIGLASKHFFRHYLRPSFSV